MVIAVIMAVLDSTILDQIIFKDDIDKEMIEMVDRHVQDQVPARLPVIKGTQAESQVEIDSLDHRNIDLYQQISKNPTINTVSTSVTSVPIRNDDGSITNKNQRTVSNTPIANPKIKEADLNNNNLIQLRKQHEE